ncbi:zinc finger MYM-type protein 1 [Folsomia candida]|uniref:zinc finger MYM-type protein 1 n=1 Tax=Folsomia candida TaxID=158441 RepID=UPI000B8EEB01|nr:zinc finger MYM-type protein 1 [Folsomia candida]
MWYLTPLDGSHKQSPTKEMKGSPQAQEIALRGHRENEQTSNRGNFIEILELLKQKCPDLAKNVESMPGNAKYIDHHIQNEIIELSGKLTRGMIVKEIQDGSNCYSVIAVETKDKGGIEQLSVCVRYLCQCEIVERFLGFTDLHKFDAESITDGISKMIINSGLDITRCVSQAYDGVMSGNISGVCKRFQSQVGGPTPYVHCYAHRLNFVLVDCCADLKDIKEVIGLIQAIYNFQSQSVRRSEYFKDAQAMIGYDKILELPKSCDTRRSSQKNGISYFHNRLDSVILALENISENGKPADLAECKGFLHQLKSFRTLLLIFILD